MDQISNYLQQILVDHGPNVLVAVVIVLLGHWLARRVIRFTRSMLLQHDLNPTIVRFAGDILYVTLLAVVAIAALSRLGIPMASFIAILGAMGLAIGLALQGSLSNVASGLVLVTLRPCEIGDYVQVGGESGTVESITVFYTTLITPDHRTITVPNSMVLGDAIINYSRSPQRRLDIEFLLSHNANVQQARDVVTAVVLADDRVVRSDDFTVSVSAISALGKTLIVRQWVSNSDYWGLRSDLLERISNALQTAGIPLSKHTLISTAAGQIQ